jgi:hypothetical protein
MLTIHLVLITLLVERDDADATNALRLLDTAETNVLHELLGAEHITQDERKFYLNDALPVENLDNLLTRATQNGARDIFTEPWIN